MFNTEYLYPQQNPVNQSAAPPAARAPPQANQAASASFLFGRQIGPFPPLVVVLLKLNLRLRLSKDINSGTILLQTRTANLLWLNLPQVTTTTAYAWWKEQQPLWKVMSILARRFMYIPASTATTERGFKQVKRFSDAAGHELQPGTLGCLLLVNDAHPKERPAKRPKATVTVHSSFRLWTNASQYNTIQYILI